MKRLSQNFIWMLLQLSMGWIFLWAFLDKTFGLGFATSSENAWLLGGSPTAGFLTHATSGPFADFFQSLAGSGAVDLLFMLGLFFTGASLLFGVLVRFGALTGATLLILMYLASALPPENNPFLDDHLVYAIIMIGFAVSPHINCIGCSRWWGNRKAVKSHPILR